MQAFTFQAEMTPRQMPESTSLKKSFIFHSVWTFGLFLLPFRELLREGLTTYSSALCQSLLRNLLNAKSLKGSRCLVLV